MVLVQSLLEGMDPTVTRESLYDGSLVRGESVQYQLCGGSSPVIVAVPPACCRYNYDQIKRSRISFASGSTSLSDADRRFLDNIVMYVQADSTVERVFVDGHTDSSGSRIDNRALSEERANAVADYLIGQGHRG